MKGSSVPKIPTATTYKATKKEERELHGDKRSVRMDGSGWAGGWAGRQRS